MKRTVLRKLILALEGVEERPHMDRTAFRTRRKIFATLGADARLNLMVEPEERRAALLESFPEAFFSLGGWSRLGYIAVDTGKVDDDLLRELLRDAHHDALPRPASRRAGAPRARTGRAERSSVARSTQSSKDRVELPTEVPDATRPIVEAAVKTLRSLAPASAEEVACGARRPRSASMMWKLVRFVIDRETVVTVGTFSGHASMFFGRGATLPDPRGILEGEGKILRYITLRSPVDATRPSVKALVKKAFSLAGT